mmetsp:Transcript_15863/g.26224  ORF Transcript_15863/g.26224 Transcript_15863/m.26224 type:complete len:109 (+) Transcript_15863:32-358(+)
MGKGEGCAVKALTGIAFGGMVGASFGFLFGTFEAFRNRFGFGDGVRFIGRSMGASAMGFSVFMGVGAFIRCEELLKEAEEPRGNIPRLQSDVPYSRIYRQYQQEPVVR